MWLLDSLHNPIVIIKVIENWRLMNIHPTALIESGAILGANTTIGEYSVVRASCVIGKNVTIGSFCDLGMEPGPTSFTEPLIIGDNSVVRSHSVFYSGSSFGSGLSTGHRVTVREGTIAGIGFQIGTGSDIQGDCEIGDYVRTHSDVHISKKSKIGSFVWLFPGVILTNDPMPPSNILRGVSIGDFAVLAVGVKVMPGIKVGSGSLIGAGSILKMDAQPDSLYSGNPAKFLGKLSALPLLDETGSPAYPWKARFSRGYPEEIVNTWDASE
jgi:acetyltransferase-like isoleucine patch superfamily enzyme